MCLVGLLMSGTLSGCGIWAYLLQGMWGLSSPTRDPSHLPCIARWILHHWAPREVPIQSFLKLASYKTDQGASLIAQSVKNLPARQETQVQSLGWEDPLEKEIAAHSNILAWRILWTAEPGRLQYMGSQESDTT